MDMDNLNLSNNIKDLQNSNRLLSERILNLENDIKYYKIEFKKIKEQLYNYNNLLLELKKLK